MDMDFSQYPNPYDFAYPVTDENLFVGREKELEDIKYYLDHAAKARRPISLALIGERASGKTSFLNIIEIEGKKRDFCCGRVDLDEGDASSQLNFFFKVFDGILGAACEKGAYGGLAGKTFEAYFDMVNTYEVPDDKTFCPFFFPIQYARAMAAGNLNAAISDHQIKRDLTNIAQETNVPILILFDETDVLAQSRSHLQKIRNVFMNTPGYMLVFSGTPRLFPVMDDVFSPIIRQFKKIPVKNFEEQQATLDCITKPLLSVGIYPGRILDPETYKDVSELHHLAEGKPYEIQLMCHTMFRRVQMGKATRMILDVGVLEDVRKELESSLEGQKRSVIDKLLHISSNDLAALNLLCICDTEADIQKASALDYILTGEATQKHENLINALENFDNQGILCIDSEGRITFVGDQFDRIYAKYLAKHRGVVLPFGVNKFSDYWQYKIHGYLDSYFRTSYFGLFSEAIVSGLVSLNAMDSNECIYNLELRKEFQSEDDYSLWEETIIVLFLAVQAMSHLQSPRMLRVMIELPWLKSDVVYFPDLDLIPEERKGQKEFLFSDFHARYFADIEKRARSQGAEFEVCIIEVPLQETEAYLRRAMVELSYETRSVVANVYLDIMVAFHLGSLRPEAAMIYLEAALAFQADLEPNMANNCGYIYLYNGLADKARPLLQKAVESLEDVKLLALAYHNSGVLEAMCQNHTIALDMFRKSAQILHDSGTDEYICAALLSPKEDGNYSKFEEVRNADLLYVNAKCLTMLKPPQEI